MIDLKRLIAATVLGFAALAQAAEPIDINTASADALAAAIDGVGEQRAASIVAYRDENGPFRSVDDLTKVRGIGPAIVAGSRDALTVGEPAQ